MGRCWGALILSTTLNYLTGQIFYNLLLRSWADCQASVRHENEWRRIAFSSFPPLFFGLEWRSFHLWREQYVSRVHSGPVYQIGSSKSLFRISHSPAFCCVFAFGVRGGRRCKISVCDNQVALFPQHTEKNNYKNTHTHSNHYSV